MLGTEAFAELIGLIYDCALDPDCWPDALARIMETLHFCNAALSLMDMRAGATVLSITNGVEEPWLSRMTNYTQEVIDQWGGLETLNALPLEEPYILTRINPRAVTAENRYYTEWARPQRIIDLMGIGLVRDNRMIGTIGLGRHESAGAIREADVETAWLLIPHLQRAVAISRLLDLRQLTANSMEAVLKRLSTPVFIVSAGAHLVWRNSAADELLGTVRALRIRSDRLVLQDGVANQALNRALISLTGQDRRASGMGCDIPLQDKATGRLLSLYVLPLPMARGGTGGGGGGPAVIFVGPHGPQRDPSEIVGALFGLTRTERRIFSRVAAGGTVAEIARDLAVSDATVRTHLGQLFEKTGTHRQAELVALFNSFRLPVRSE
ncbi:MAG: hypothetical protein BGP16_10895 [Sphingobium sp. 66-54]|nr:MAG: hypothetical protein BGP16_10895 [Sphingobium sp. 66-54]